MGDGRINEAQRHLSRSSPLTIATQQPVARDLRLLLALDHVTYELERMGDHAGVRRQAGAQAGARSATARRTSSLPEMGRLAADQCATCCGPWSTWTRQSPARSPPGTTRSIDLYHSIFAEMLQLMRADPANVDRGTRILFAAHYLERIGDRVTNVAEDVVFLATGDTEDLNP